MFPNKIAGNVDIINGLNHYIGMKTLHTNDFIEFTVLPYIIIFFAAFCFVAAIIKQRKSLSILVILFIFFHEQDTSNESSQLCKIVTILKN